MSNIIRSTSFSPLWHACLGAALALSLAGCAGPSVQDYAKEQPQLDLRQYFNGPLTACKNANGCAPVCFIWDALPAMPCWEEWRLWPWRVWPG